MTAALIRGDALALPLADASVDLIISSPPYWALRSYSDDGGHYAGQLGSEPTPGEFVDALIAATAEMVRVLKPSGSLWVNLGDKYGPTKSLMGLPWRYAIRCMGHGTALGDPEVVRLLVRDVALGVISLAVAEQLVDDLAGTPDPGLGLILRAEVIWSKPNGLPESVTDRVRRSHEQWFHFTRQPRYFAAMDAVREATPDIGRKAKTVKAGPLTGSHGSMGTDGAGMRMDEVYNNPLGKLPGSVWSVPSQPLTVPASVGVDHFAAFPMEWPRRIIQGWSPSGICTTCGEGRRPVVAKTLQLDHMQKRTSAPRRDLTEPNGNSRGFHTLDSAPNGSTVATITGEQCACPEPTAPTRPAIVLDPFGGTGTVAMVAHALGRHGISHDMSGDYCRLARWRTNDPGERAKAAGVERPPAAPDDMDPLW